MKIRVLSDLHVDVNADYPLTLKNKDIFTIVAGDTAGYMQEGIRWIRDNIKQGIIISGNHIVYSSDVRPIQDLKRDWATAFPITSPVSYLDCMTGIMCKEINNILFIGTTLYTDYALSANDTPEYSMRLACHPSRGMNDFRYGYTKDKEGKIRHIHPTDYRRWFIESKKEITRLVQSNPNKEIVLITHHCPSAKCGVAYEELSASYASNLEDFIRDNPNIKLWVAGHVHQRKNFRIGNCLILMNPRGYEGHGESIGFNPNTFVDTKDWSVHQVPLKISIKQQKDAFLKQLIKQMLYSL